MVDDGKKSKTYQEYAEFVSNNLSKPATAKLTEISALSDLKEEIADILKTLYDNDDKIVQRMGTLFNAIYTHQTSTFAITNALFNELVKKDPHHDLESCDSVAHKDLMNRLMSQGILITVRPVVYKAPGVKSKSGVYELVHPKFREPLITMIGEDVCKARKEAVLKWYDEGYVDQKVHIFGQDPSVAKEPKTEEQLRIERKLREREQKRTIVGH